MRALPAHISCTRVERGRERGREIKKEEKDKSRRSSKNAAAKQNKKTLFAVISKFKSKFIIQHLNGGAPAPWTLPRCGSCGLRALP